MTMYTCIKKQATYRKTLNINEKERWQLVGTILKFAVWLFVQFALLGIGSASGSISRGNGNYRITQATMALCATLRPNMKFQRQTDIYGALHKVRHQASAIDLFDVVRRNSEMLAEALRRLADLLRCDSAAAANFVSQMVFSL